MNIHWFPGHMTKALREMKENAAKIDCVIYVLDSRAPMSCVNPAFDPIIGNKPGLYVLNKVDLVPAEEAERWRVFVEKRFGKCLTLNSALKGGSGKLVGALREVCKERIEHFKNRGIKKTIRAMVIGVPNSGKSTLINSLTAKKRTVTGDRPGVTRGPQWVAIDPYIDLLDTPGTLYPDFSDQQKAVNLAIIGSIKEDVLDITELAVCILKFLAERYPDRLYERYKLAPPFEGNAGLERVARERGCVLKGGALDIVRASKAVILDARGRGFGKIIFEDIPHE